MSAIVFVDSNVLVYDRDSSETSKQPQAAAWIDALWKARSGRISFQVLHEYYVTVTAKLSPGLTTREAQEDVRHLMAWDPLPLDAGTLEGAFVVEDRFGFSFWDSLIVASAQRAECSHLLTEDLQAGQDVDGVVIVNPFDSGPELL